jgi:tetratricopeptide (TPR) repeat protein
VKGCFVQFLGSYDINTDAMRVAVATTYHKESALSKRKGLYPQALKMAFLAKRSLPDPIPQEHLNIVQDQVALLDILAKYRDVQSALQSYPGDHQAGILWKKRMGARLEDAECANKYNSALELFHQIQTARESGSDSKADLLLTIDDLAWALMLRGKYLDAVAESREALVGRTTLLGASHADTLTSCHNFTEILRRDGKYDEALRYIQDAIRGRENLLGDDHPETTLQNCESYDNDIQGCFFCGLR